MSEKRLSTQESAQIYLRDARKSNGIPGDLWNAMAGVQFNVSNSRSWPNLQPALTFAEYLHDIKFRDNPALADAVIKTADAAEVAKFDAIVVKMNKIISEGVRHQGPANVLNALLDDVRELIYGRRNSPKL